MDWLLSAIGLVILLLAGDALVKGAVNLSLRLGVPALIVSLTIVAFGTSAPELLIAIRATLDNAPGIALGNVVGSNTANILLVLGIPAIISVLDTSNCASRKIYGFMLLATLLFIALAFTGEFGLWQGAVLLAALGYSLRDAFLQARDHRQETGTDPADLTNLEAADQSMSGGWIALYLLLGLVGLPLGAEVLVSSATSIARSYHLSETAIGLTLIAIGTSLPELATTVMSAIRRQADVAIGNVIGSNMFNLLAIIGITALIGDVPVPRAFLVFDLWVMLGASLLLAPFVVWRMKLTRLWGVLLTGSYLAYVTIVLS